MATLPDTAAALKALRASLVPEYQAAKAASDATKMKQFTDLAGEIDDTLDTLALIGLAQAAQRLAAYAARFEALTQLALTWPFGKGEASADHERAHREALPDNDFQDVGPDAPPPAPAPVPSDTVPSVSIEWAQDYRKLWDTMTVSGDWQKKGSAIATRIIASQGRYAATVAGTSVPWWFVAVVHAMECSLRFDQHLHNGDPLTATTIRVPKNRPPAGNPPFTWERSARDAIEFERLTSIVDWSLENVLFNWHRYNGINNEYKRQGIPTPYLWSGSQHYRKGKYVRDGEFDANAVSAQVGAAVLLKALVDLGAVKLGGAAVESNAAAATGSTKVLSIDTSGTDFAHVANELDYPGHLKKGAGTTSAEVKSVRRIQEWLNIHNVVTPVDGGFGDSTTDQLKAFQTAHGRPATGELDEESWALLTAPMRHALAKVDIAPGTAFEDVVVAVGQQHIAQHPIEVGGNNCGPWVRLYMQGQEGESQAWCAGFVYLVVAQAARDLKEIVPFQRQVWVPTLVADAKKGRRLVLGEDVNTPIKRASKVRPGNIFVVRGNSPRYTHTGIVLALKENTFDTLEGNTGGDGGVDGANARQGNRAFGNYDFLRLF